MCIIENDMKTFIVLIIIFLAIGAGLIWFNKENALKDKINSFEECAVAGYPIMESYPEQCRTPDGKIFVRKILIEAESPTPAAGVCMPPPKNGIAEVSIYEDIPQPRCHQVEGSDFLKVINKTKDIITVRFGEEGSIPYFSSTIEPDESYVFKKSLGDFLSSGVHHLKVSPHPGPEIWVDPDPRYLSR